MNVKTVSIFLITLFCLPIAAYSQADKFFNDKSLELKTKPLTETKISISLFKTFHETVKQKIRFIGNPADGEMSALPYFMATKSISVKQLMDGMTSVYPVRWQKTIENNKPLYILKDSQHNFDRAYGASTLQAENIYRQGKILIDQLKKNKSNSEKLFLRPNELATARFGILSPEIQSSIQYMMEQNSERRRLRGQNPIDTSDLSSSQFGIEKQASPGDFDEYALRFRVSNGGGMFRFTTYERGKTEQGENFYSAASNFYSSATLSYDLKKMATESLKNVRNSPELKNKKISLNVENKRLWEIALILHEKYQLNIMMDGKGQHTQRATFSLQDEPLSEALDRLTEIYKSTNWECRPGGFIIFRGPGNSLVGSGNFLEKTVVK